MKKMKKIMCAVLALVLMLSVLSACGKKDVAVVTEAPATTEIEAVVPAETEAPEAAEVAEAESGFYQIGDKIEDFTVTTYDGKEVSLYKVLEEKDMVLVNIWASWCGPCGSEFPAMQEAYEKYQDKVEIIALSSEPTDTDEVLAAYAQEKGMTFCVANDSIGFRNRIDSTGIPTSVIVDRFGTICLIESGAMPEAYIFENVFSVYTAEDYTESVFMPSMMSEKPNVQPSDPALLNEALNGEGGKLVFANSDNVYHWPMTVAEKDGRNVVTAPNTSSYFSVSSVQTTVDAKAGDVLVVEYKLDCEAYNQLQIEVDGDAVKKTSKSSDWTTYAYQFKEDGTHNVNVIFDLMWYDNAQANGLWIDSIRIVSGDEAAKALAANPQYPVGEENSIVVVNESAKQAYFYIEEDPADKAPMVICPDEKLQILVTVDESADPEVSYVEDADYSRLALLSHMTENGYTMEVRNATEEEMIGGATLYCDGQPLTSFTVFPSEDAVNAYFELIRQAKGINLMWAYGEITPAGEVAYKVTYVDQNGDPVPGVMCQVCDESTCQVFTSDANGVCQFTLPAKAYEIHTLMVPAGYEGDTTTVTQAPAGGGELTFTLTKK